MQEPQATKHVSGQAVVECRARPWFQDEVCAGIRAFETRSAALRAGLRQSGRAFLCLPGIYASARGARLGDMPGYYQSSRQGGTGVS